MVQHVPLQAQKPLLHSYPFGEVMIVKDTSHSDMLIRLYWQLALEEKAPAQALFNTLVLYYSGNLRKMIPFCSLGVFPPVLAGPNATWITEPRAKASTEVVVFPFCCIKILVKGHVMLNTVILTKHTLFLSWYVLLSWPCVLSWKTEVRDEESDLCIYGVASSCSLKEAAGFREYKLLHSTCCYASSETVNT